MAAPVLLLVIHDTPAAIEATDALTARGCVVLLARTSYDALQALDRVQPDAVLVQVEHGLVRGGRGWSELSRRAARSGTRGYLVAVAGSPSVPVHAQATTLPAWPEIRLGEPGDFLVDLDLPLQPRPRLRLRSDA